MIDIQELAKAVRTSDRTSLSRAITLVESTRVDDREKAVQLLQVLLPYAGNAHRVGITGVPGVGKSTFIDELGSRLTNEGQRVAVLAVDPSSSVSGGSILGDKTRMNRLAVDDRAYVRASPSAGTLGGVTRSTQESMVLLEAAGFDVILVETVGVGQSETVVAEMVDFFLVLMLPGAGDELQGIKKGVLELADMLVVNKADGDTELQAERSAQEFQAALHLLTPTSTNWMPSVLTCSALSGHHVDVIWEQIELHRRNLLSSGEWEERRRSQKLSWMWGRVEERLLERFHRDQMVAGEVEAIEQAVRDDELSPSVAAERLLRSFDGVFGKPL